LIPARRRAHLRETALPFGVRGDMPYKKTGDNSKLPAVLQSINRADIAFSIYDGDIKDGSFDTPERLSHIRRVMFPTINSLGQTQVALEHQGKAGEKFVGNTRFTHSGVMFVGINMPGSNNNVVLNEQERKAKSVRTPAQCDAANAEYLERDAANVEWLAESFALARTQNAMGLVLTVQADPGFDLPETPEFDSPRLIFPGTPN